MIQNKKKIIELAKFFDCQTTGQLFTEVIAEKKTAFIVTGIWGKTRKFKVTIEETEE